VDLKNVKPSKNFEDIRFRQSSDRILNALIESVDPYSQVNRGLPLEPNAYGKYLQWQYDDPNLTGNEKELLDNLKKYGYRTVLDQKLLDLFYGGANKPRTSNH